MGLDSVALIFAVEKIFDIEISAGEAESIVNIGEFADCVHAKIMLLPAEKCISQILFYRIRKALGHFGNLREPIKPDSKISEFLPEEHVAENWKRFEQLIELKLPDLVRRDLHKNKKGHISLFGVKIYASTEPITEQTIRKLMDWIISINFENILEVNALTNKYQVERIVCGVISDQVGIPINEIELTHTIANDLGID